jgi:hypothetical protein
VLLVAGLVSGNAGADKAPPLPPPARTDEAGLPALPRESPRNASYTIDAKLDSAHHAIEGTLVLEWRNITTRTVSSLPFHLYWNAFSNDLSTFARESKAVGSEPSSDDRRFGYVHVQEMALVGPMVAGSTETDLMPSFRYTHPDDDNADDRTVAEVAIPGGIGPGQRARFRIRWTARIPYGGRGRSGWVGDYHFIAQWFPKVGVLEETGWNCHQFHRSTEFFSDYGVYDVRLTVPGNFKVGATGRLVDERAQPGGAKTLHFHEEDVHDFAWTASPDFLEREAHFDDPGYPPVAIRLLLQPEHADVAERYLEATKIALRAYGTWSAPYPYGHVTVVDPAWNSASGGMEYPTLFTGGVRLFAPPSLQSPELVTIHECGHQFWYGLVGNNEFEEAWLDEGFNTYHEAKAAGLFLGARSWGRRYFGSAPGRGPVFVPRGVFLSARDEMLETLRSDGTTDVMAREGWRYRTRASYGLNSYDKPALVLQTLEALVGDETMTRIMRTYARKYRFAHPTTRDFIETVEAVTGRDWKRFFDETFYSSEICDYAVEVRDIAAPKGTGYQLVPGAAPPFVQVKETGERSLREEAEVTVLRLGGVRLPVDLLVEFADGGHTRETWDGEYRWVRFRYPKKVRRAVVDPDNKLAIDVDPSNNSWVEATPEARRAALKWSARWMLWVQNLFELETLFS